MMNVVTEPTVVVVAATQFFGNSDFSIPPDGTDAERLGAYAAKRCYRSSGVNGRSNVENQMRVIENRHGSVLEHSFISLDISGITRACSLELNRHRQFGISQESTRYVDLEDGGGSLVLEPYYAAIWSKCLEDFHAAPDGEASLVLEHINTAGAAFDIYTSQVEQLMALNPLQLSGVELRKWARGKARNILPHGMETAGVWTGNYRAWRWFLQLRSDGAAEDEIRRLAEAIYLAIRPYAPTYFADFEVTDVRGISQLTPTYEKI